MNNPNPNDCHVRETISVYKFQQVLGSLQLARQVALDEVAYENAARGVKGLKILRFSRCNEGKIVDGAVNNPKANDCHVIETISVYKFQQVLGSLQLTRKVALDQEVFENEARSLQNFTNTRFESVM